MDPTRLLLIPFLMVVTWTSAQQSGIRLNIDSDNYSVLNWTSEEGLPQNAIRGIAEDQNGMIWIATFGGLARFDGNSFKIFDETNVAEITHPTILSIHVDKENNLWITTVNELLKYRDGIFQRFDLPSLSYHFIFEYKSKAHLWSGIGVYKTDGTPIYESEPHPNERIRVDHVFALENDIVCLMENKLIRLSDSSRFHEGKFDKMGHNYRTTGQNYVKSIDSKNVFHVQDDGLKEIKLPLNNPLFTASLKSGLRYTMNRDSIHIGNTNGTLFTTSFDALNTSIASIFHVSDDGVIFIGSMNNGLYMLYPKRFKSISSRHPKIFQTGDFVYQSSDSTIWLDGSCMQLFSTRDYGNTLTEHEVRSCSWGMVEADNDDFWTISLHRGPYKNNEPPKFPVFIEERIIAHSIYKDAHNKTFIGTDKGVYEMADDTLYYVENSKDFEIVYCFYEDRQGQLLFCSSTGVGSVEGRSARRTKFLKENHDVRSLYQDEDLNYWVGTADDGLFLFDNESTYHFSPKNRSIPVDVWCILEDKKGYFWMNSDNGIFRVSREELMAFSKGQMKNVYSIRFGSHDGLVNPEGNSRTQNKAFIDFDGNMWFSTIAGPVWINPLDVGSERFKNPILIDEILIDGETVKPDNIVLHPENDYVQFTFAQANFLDTKHLGYQYKIEGLDNNWIDLGNVRTINLTELPAGDFELVIRQVGTNITLAIPFSVEVYFYESTLFLIGAGVVGATIILLFSFWLWRKQRRNTEKIQELNVILSNLKVKALQSQMNPHFIFNCLSSIQSLYIIDEKDKANRYMSNFSALLRMVLSHAEKRETSIQEEIDMYNVYIPLEALQLNDSFTYTVELEPTIDPEATMIPSMIVQTFIENAIKHGLRPLTEREGKLTIHIREEGNEVVIIIEDNGIGVDESLRLKKTMDVAYESKGTKITEERIELMNVLSELGARVITSPLYTDSEQQYGTRVQLFFAKKTRYEDSNN